MEVIIYTADDEEPECNRCEHVDDDYFCVKKCGPEHGWNGYARVESYGIECPFCGYEVARNDDFDEIRPEHCPKCGTKLLY